MAWFVLMSDYDVEGIDVHGPFTSEKEAEMWLEERYDFAEDWAERDGEVVEYDLTLEQVQYLCNEAYEPLVEKDNPRAQPRRVKHSGEVKDLKSCRRTLCGAFAMKKRQSRRGERHEARRFLKFI